MESLILLGGFFFFCLLGVPIGVAIGISVLLFLLTSDITNVQYVAQGMYSNLQSFPLLAVPFFMLTGSIMEKGGLSQRLIKVAKHLVGNIVGGLGAVTIVSCMFFGAISGSAPATVAAIGGIMIPSMVKNGYPKNYATGLTAVSGSLGVLIPPSIPFVLYGLATGTSVGALFIAGIGPGILVTTFLIIVAYLRGRQLNLKGMGRKFNLINFIKDVWDAKYALFVPIIILGGIYIGVFTPTEAAIVAVVYGLVIGLFVYKELKIRDLYSLFVDNGVLVGAVVFTIATATTLGRLFSMLQVPTQITVFLSNISNSTIVIMILINIFLLFVGMVMDVAAAIIVLSPLLYAVLVPLGINPVHLGIIITANLCIGFVTPPVAINLFVASGVSGLGVMEISKSAIPFIIALFLALVLIIFIPEITLFLPTLFGLM